MTYNICPTCFQEMKLPPDIGTFHTTPAETRILTKLYENRERVVRFLEFPMSRKSLFVMVNRVRGKLRDNGAPYVISSVRSKINPRASLGYRLQVLRIPDPNGATERPKDLHT